MKKIILKLLFLILTVSSLVYGTIAFFNDTEKSTNNTFAAGTINLKLGNHGYYDGVEQTDNSWELRDLTIEKFFTLSDLKPGDWGENTIAMTVGSNNAFACAHLKTTSNEDNTIVDPEDMMDGVRDSLDGTLKGDLPQQLNFIFWADDGDNVFEDNEAIILQNNVANAIGGMTYTIADSTINYLDNNPSLDPAKTYHLSQAWCYGDLIPSPLTQDGFSDQRDPSGSVDNSGILCSGDMVTNLSQTDSLTADLTFYAVQSENNNQFVCSDSLFPPSTTTHVMENKVTSGTWPIIDNDDTYGELEYTPEGPTFDYSFSATGLIASKDYCLIYYADGWPGNHPGAFINSGKSDTNGNLSFSGSPDLGISLPTAPDENLLKGAKVWLIPCDQYDQPIKSIKGWSPSSVDWLFGNDDNGEFVHYTRTTAPTPTPVVTPTPTPVVTPISTPTSTPPSGFSQINLDELGGDVNAQYGYNYDYSQASVSFLFENSQNNPFSGNLSAANLKPYTTYQIKVSGIPTCQNSAGDNAANEYIGYKGRWTCLDCGGTALSRNRSDAQYVANKALPDSDPSKECIGSYLVFDYFTADASGNATKTIEADSSYHVLWCGEGVCGTSSNTNLAHLDPAHPTQYFCPDNKVNGQLERFACGGMALDSGTYNLLMSLTEESFHTGNWAQVLQKPISFVIN